MPVGIRYFTPEGLLGLHRHESSLLNKAIRKASFDVFKIHRAGYKDTERSLQNTIYYQSPSQSKSASPALTTAFNQKSKRNIFNADTSNRQPSTQSFQALDLTVVFDIHLERSELSFSRGKCSYKTPKIRKLIDRSVFVPVQQLVSAL